MPTSAYSEISSTISSAEPDGVAVGREDAGRGDERSLSSVLEEVSDGSDSELADFEKLVDLVISEHAKLEFTPDPNGLLVFGLLLACAVAVGTVPRLFGVSEELSFNV